MGDATREQGTENRTGRVGIIMGTTEELPVYLYSLYCLLFLMLFSEFPLRALEQREMIREWGMGNSTR